MVRHSKVVRVLKGIIQNNAVTDSDQSNTWVMLSLAQSPTTVLNDEYMHTYAGVEREEDRKQASKEGRKEGSKEVGRVPYVLQRLIG